MAGTLVAIGLLLLLLAWFFWPRASADSGPPTAQRPGVDAAELEAAERDVREARDEESVRDWGPGTRS